MKLQRERWRRAYEGSSLLAVEAGEYLGSRTFLLIISYELCGGGEVSILVQSIDGVLRCLLWAV
jgi:hypothetical protein